MNEVREDELVEVLIFELAGQRYGLPASDVHELIRVVTSTPLPGAPAIVEGAINLRGRLVPVFDIRTRFRLPAKAPEPSDHLIVAWAGERLAAIRVDQALELMRLESRVVENTEGVLPGVGYIPRVAKLPEGLVLIHDLNTFLSEAESAALRQALAPPAAATEEKVGP
jgi:purine-binding chemotaxis protein CheW